jgi:threonine 3-dehydrogenase
MKALAKTERKVGLTLIETDIPKIKPDEVLIKIKKTAICGTDLHIYQWDDWAQQTIPVPMVVGHEFVGEIVELGSHVKDLKLGTRVSGEGHIVCNSCRNCRAGKRHLCPKTLGIGVNIPGAFAEYLAMPASNVFPLPDIIPDDIAAMFDPFGNSVHTALAFDCVGEDVLVTGAGPIGIMCALIAKHIGARHVVITDINDNRLAQVSSYDGITAVNTTKETLEDVQKRLGMTEGFDVGLEASGNNSALNSMIDNILNGGKISLIGLYKGNINIDMNKVIFKGIDLKGIYGRQMYETWYKMVTLIQSGLDISKIITDRYHFTDFEKGFQKMISGNCGKIILSWE